jgi:hypothetical protein
MVGSTMAPESPPCGDQYNDANVTIRHSEGFKGWLDEFYEYLRILATTTLLFLFFKFMRFIDMGQEYVDLLEKLDEAATVVVFGSYALTLSIRAIFGVRNRFMLEYRKDA